MEPNQQPERLNQWSANRHERRTAVFIAGVCIVIIAAVLIAPRWFASKGGDADNSGEQAESMAAGQQPEQSEQPTYRISSAPAVAGVSAETPVEHASPQPAAAPEPAQVTPAEPEPAATVSPPPAPKPVVAPVKPKPATTTAPHQTAVSKAPAGYFVQVGSFKERKLADSLLKKLTDHGFNSRLVDRGNGMIGVWIGPEDNHKAAETLQQELQKRLNMKGFITHSG